MNVSPRVLTERFELRLDAPHLAMLLELCEASGASKAEETRQAIAERYRRTLGPRSERPGSQGRKASAA